jgi:hypothetical protein
MSLLFSDAYGASGEFVKLQFGHEISIEVPRSWQYQNDNIRQKINLATDATVSLAGITTTQKGNVILVSASTFTSYKNPSATLHLNIRPAETMKQEDMRKLVPMTRIEVESVFGSADELLKNTYQSVDYIKSATIINYKVVSNDHISCLFTESEITKTDGVVFLTQSWVCPSGNKFVKLGSSYNKHEENLFKPVITYVWKHLKFIDL